MRFSGEGENGVSAAVSMRQSLESAGIDGTHEEEGVRERKSMPNECSWDGKDESGGGDA